jgi:hypothetical protein
MKTLIASMLVLCSSLTFAAENITLGDVTYFPTVKHFQEKNRYGHDWNTETNCVKIVLDNGLTFGTMKNSHFKQSTFAGYTARPLKIGNVSAGALVGLVSGYNSKEMPTKAPLLGAGSILWQATKTHHVEVIVVPTVGKSSGFVSVGFGMSF